MAAIRDSSRRVLGHLSMGAPKQKWTSEEENALKAGVVKHGAGKWRTILKDPEFSSILCLRSNVDLKDKWRNMSVTANGFGSREKARIALKRSHHVPRHDDNPLALSNDVADVDDQMVDAQPIAASPEILAIAAPKKSISRLDNLIVEAITTLKEPSGSNKTAISLFIEEQYWAPPNFRKILQSKLKSLTASGRLIRVKRRYRLAPAFMEARNPRLLRLEGKKQEERPQEVKPQKEPSRGEKDEIRVLSKPQIDAELLKIRNMSAKDAEAAAAQAVAEAEAAMAVAEEAAREAEAAEADAEVAQAFADAAVSTLKSRMTTNPSLRV
ncbi:Telomere repeat-binding factor 1 [Acorus calamus]|uniref:Telomere repeat-binding factor 1 n=1 Tax=Acorus calamus TaxID=4465 RepID=A0AAV9FGU3_ACOCL|nr:Telomere repeat-binding factor 1 [Acorus calamus]